MELLKNLSERIKEGASVNDPVVERLICEIAICCSNNIIDYSDFNTVINQCKEEKDRYDCMLFYDAISFYLNNYAD